MLMRIVAGLALIALFSLSRPAMAELSGVYIGLDESQGARLQFQPGGNRLQVSLTGLPGAPSSFSADKLETGAEATVNADGRKLTYVFTEEALGVSLIIFPLDAKGLPIAAETVAYGFVREGLSPPPRPARYVDPPEGPGGTIDPRAFVESYAFWPSRNVAYGYGMVRGRYRTLIRLHPVVQADILWKLCRADASSAALADALRGQGVGCDAVLAAFGRMLKPGGAVAKFNAFRRDVEAQKAALVEAIVCSVDYRRSDPDCKRAGARVAKAAVSLETVKTVLSRY
ncbi:MAG: hypothetical protein WD969_00540 [Paracoccaceae bacterium]